MRLTVLCLIVYIFTPLCGVYSAAPLNTTEWRLDYSTGDAVLINSANAVLERYPLQKVSNLRLLQSNPPYVWGDTHYTQKNGEPVTLTFQSSLKITKISEQNDEALHLKVLLYRYCTFVCRAYHLLPDTVSITPYTLLPETSRYSDIHVDELALKVMFTHTVHYQRPLDNSEYVHSRQLTAPINRRLLGYTYRQTKKESYPTFLLTAHHDGYELFNKKVTSPPLQMKDLS